VLDDFDFDDFDADFDADLDADFESCLCETPPTDFDADADFDRLSFAGTDSIVDESPPLKMDVAIVESVIVVPGRYIINDSESEDVDDADSVADFLCDILCDTLCDLLCPAAFESDFFDLR
jgi:hypothetical protein